MTALILLVVLLAACPVSAQNIDGQAGGASLTVKENDNIPNVSGVSSISFTNGDGVSGNPTLSLPSSIDLGGKTLEIPHSTTLPATCGVGQIYMDTDATSGQRLYLCQASNTWALQGDGGGGGSSSTGSAIAVQTADGAGAFTDSGCTATGGAMTCSGGFTSGGAGVGIVTMKEGTAPDGVIRGEDGTWYRGAFDFVAGGGGGSSHAISGSVSLFGGVVMQ